MKKENQNKVGFYPNTTHHPDGNRATRRSTASEGVNNNRKSRRVNGVRKPRRSLLVEGTIGAFVQRVADKTIVHYVDLVHRRKKIAARRNKSIKDVKNPHVLDSKAQG